MGRSPISQSGQYVCGDGSVRRERTISDSGHRAKFHHHKCGQMLYVHSGSTVLQLTERAWFVSEGDFCWIPSHAEHRGDAFGDFSACLWWGAEKIVKKMPSHPCLLEVPDASLRLLLSFPRKDTGKVPAHQVLALLGDVRPRQFSLAFPRSTPLQEVASEFVVSRDKICDLDRSSRKAGMSRRSFTRHFALETGVSFSSWVSLLRCRQATPLLRRGHSVDQISRTFGYKSSSAFIAMFRKSQHCTPGSLS